MQELNHHPKDFVEMLEQLSETTEDTIGFSNQCIHLTSDEPLLTS